MVGDIVGVDLVYMDTIDRLIVLAPGDILPIDLRVVCLVLNRVLRVYIEFEPYPCPFKSRAEGLEDNLAGCTDSHRVSVVSDYLIVTAESRSRSIFYNGVYPFYDLYPRVSSVTSLPM